MTYTFIEYEFSQQRSSQYAKANRRQDFEVLYAGHAAPEDCRYSWEHVPGLHFRFGPLVMRSYLALRTALGYSQSDVWIVVKPDFRQLVGVCLTARGKSVEIEVWLEESQHQVWFGVTLLRAMGWEIETRHIRLGLAEFAAGGTGERDESSKGKAA